MPASSWREPSPPAAVLETWRCPKCGRILAKVRLGEGGRLEVKCRSCNTYSTKER
jgi:phage FluMu protein Com